jgi:hypothetical protein
MIDRRALQQPWSYFGDDPTGVQPRWQVEETLEILEGFGVEHWTLSLDILSAFCQTIM